VGKVLEVVERYRGLTCVFVSKGLDSCGWAVIVRSSLARHLGDVENMRCTRETTVRDGTDRISKQRCHASQTQKKRTPPLEVYVHSYESRFSLSGIEELSA
jgi:hypothetical protein